MIPGETLREIQDRLDIVQVIGEYISLRKSGRNFKTLCPFHPEKTPSFMIYPHKQFFICYGCGAGGDLVSFVMRHEHLEFLEAVSLLAQKAGVALPQGGESSGGRVSSVLLTVHEAAARFYHESLLLSKEAEAARVYLKGRGLLPETWKTFMIGYAPRRWDGLLEHARLKDFSPQVLEQGGLAIQRENEEGSYDRFRNRVMFPIGDTRGRVIAFGGRVFEEAEEKSSPKYLNSPETELYVKGRVLYGLHVAAPHIRERDFCIVVEGYMDVVSPYQHGIRNVVASMGTSLTAEQVRLIRRFTRHVVIVYDGDYAGQMATLRGLDLFLEAEMRIKVTSLPGGTDPDSLVRAQGVQALAGAIQKSQDLFDYKLGILTRQFDPKETQGRVRICEEMLPTLKRVPNAVQQGEYVKRLSAVLEVEEPLLWTELKRVKLEASWKPNILVGPQARIAMTAEDLLVGLLLEEPARMAQLAGRLDLAHFKDPQVKQVIKWLLEKSEGGSFPQDHRAFLHAAPHGLGDWEARLARWLAWADTVEDKEQALEELLDRMKTVRHRDSLENLGAKIREAETSGNETLTSQLILEYNHLVKRSIGVTT